jgi:hypothetical protein
MRAFRTILSILAVFGTILLMWAISNPLFSSSPDSVLVVASTFIIAFLGPVILIGGLGLAWMIVDDPYEI